MNLNNKLKIVLTLLIAILILNSCKVTEPSQKLVKATDFLNYRNSNLKDTTTIAEIPWQKIFTDSLLQGLIQKGIENNLDLKVAIARIKQAQANFQQSKDVFYPSLNLNANGPILKSNNASTNVGLFQLTGNASWEIFVWGKVRSTKRAALAALLQSDAYKKAVQTQLIADIATNYYNLLAYDAQLQITQKTLENRKEDVETMKNLKKSAVVTGASVVQSEANRYSVEVTIPDLKQKIWQTENTLNVLLGKVPDTIKRDSLKNQKIIIDPKIGVPSQLLANRPDVQAAEYQLRYYFELTNVARTNFYPSISITAQGGWSNKVLSQLINPVSLFGSVIGGLTQPIFNKGNNKRQLRFAKAQQEESVANFKKTLLNASQEVSNALFNYQTASEKIKFRTQQISFLQQSVSFNKELLKYTPNTNYTDVLTSEQNLLSAEINSVGDKLQQLQAIVNLYRSLGGGWK